jgi:hypothetical protein
LRRSRFQARVYEAESMAKLDLLRTISNEAAAFHLRALVETCPDFEEAIDDEVRRWLGKLAALVEELLSPVDVVELRTATNLLNGYPGPYGDKIKTILFRALGAAELALPAQLQGSFVPVGNAFDAFAAIAKVLETAQSDVLFVDAYMDHTVLERFAVAIPEKIKVRLLADEFNPKPSLQPAAQTWSAQFGQTRPLEVRLSPPRTLHDRVIQIDGREIWIATQSFAHFAARSPAVLQRFEGENRRMKIEAYEQLWANGVPLS